MGATRNRKQKQEITDMASEVLAGSRGLLFAIFVLAAALAVVAGSERIGGEMEQSARGELMKLQSSSVGESTTNGSAADSSSMEQEEISKEKPSRKVLTWGNAGCACPFNCRRCRCNNCRSCVCQKCKRGYMLNGNQCLEVVSVVHPTPNLPGVIVRAGRGGGGFGRTFGSWLVPNNDPNLLFPLLG